MGEGASWEEVAGGWESKRLFIHRSERPVPSRWLLIGKPSTVSWVETRLECVGFEELLLLPAQPLGPQGPQGAFPSSCKATGLGLVSLAWAAGAMVALVFVSQSLILLPVFLCFLSAILSLSLCSLLP